MPSKLIPMAILSLALISCDDGSSSSDADAGPDADTDTDSDTDADSDSDTDPGFNPDDPGVHMFVNLGSVYMMNQPIELAIAGFLTTAREDFDEEAPADEMEMDTCRVAEEVVPTPECETDEDCAPEQVCVPDYDDDSGEPIPGTEHCETPREPLDVGPFTMEGFASGPIEMAYNAGQSGAYTAPGSDGTLPAGTLSFDTTYTFSGDGSSEYGLGSFSGEVYVAPAMELTYPPLEELSMEGLFGIPANPAEDLVIEWSGENPDGELFISLVGSNLQGDGGSIECRVADDGEFTIPAAMVEAAELGDMAFLNMLTIDRRGTGSASGEGMTYDLVEVIQTTVINVIKSE